MGARPGVLVSLALLLLAGAGCASRKAAPADYFSSMDYQARETLGQSLFKEDLAALSSEEIDRILDSKIEIPGTARLAVLQLGGDSQVLVLPGPDAEEADILGQLVGDLEENERLSSVVLLPSLLVPRALSVAKLREAAARFQAHLLFVYRVPCQQFRRNRFVRADEAKAYCLAEGVLLDVRTGIVPFSAVASASFGASQTRDDLSAYETARRSQREAISRALAELAGELSAFLDSVP